MSARVTVLFPEGIPVRAGRWSGVRCPVCGWFVPIALEEELTVELRARLEAAIGRSKACPPSHGLELWTMEIPLDHHRAVEA
jgi:hypothetical protein